MEPDTTSRAVLAHGAYAIATHLAARQSLYQWQTPSYDLPGIVVDLLGDDPGPDIGCGNGTYLRRIRAERPELTTIGVDISPGIIEDLAGPLVVADAAQIPTASRSARHRAGHVMLYHLADIDQGVAELARVLQLNHTKL
jgi:ubiquinone/menaquinone biosynthesis C-methylase UbiE